MDVLKIIQNFMGIDFALLDLVTDPAEELYNIIENLYLASEENNIQMCGCDDTAPCAVAESY